MSLEHLYKDQEVIDEVANYFDIKAINQSLKSHAHLQAPRTENNIAVVGTVFDFYFKLLLLNYSKNTPSCSCVIGDWPIFVWARGNDGFKAISDAYKQYPEEIESLVSLPDSQQKFERLADLAQKLCYLKAWKYRLYQTLPDASASITKELYQLGELVNYDEFFIETSEVYLNPKICHDVQKYLPDILVGNTVIDIKVKDKAALRLNDIIQILAYYSLCQRESPTKNFEREPTSINQFGFYLARHGYLWRPNLQDYISKSELKRLVVFINRSLDDYLYGDW